MGLESSRGRRDRATKMWYKLVSILEKSNCLVKNKLSLVEVDRGKHGVEWLMS